MIATRADIAYAVGLVSRYMDKPQAQHWTAVKRYLKGSTEMGLMFGREQTTTFIGYSDSDWAGNIDDRRSTGGYIFLLAGGSISWNSKLQRTVALSTTESEYMALTQATKEAISLRHLCQTLGFDQESMIIMGDNQSSIALAKNPAYHTSRSILIYNIIFCVKRLQTALFSYNIVQQRIWWQTQSRWQRKNTQNLLKYWGLKNNRTSNIAEGGVLVFGNSSASILCS